MSMQLRNSSLHTHDVSSEKEKGTQTHRLRHTEM